MPKKKKRIRRKISLVKNPTIYCGERAISDVGLVDDKPHGRVLVEQDLSNILTATSFSKDSLYIKRGNGDSFSFEKALPDSNSDSDINSLVVVPDGLIKQAIETIIELDQRVDFLQKQSDGRKAPTLKRVLAAHNRKLSVLNKKKKLGKKK